MILNSKWISAVVYLQSTKTQAGRFIDMIDRDRQTDRWLKGVGY